jgi:hypothetical protein
MPPTTRRARADWAISHVLALPELWAIVAEHSGVVGAWRLTGVCRASRVGAKEWLRTLPGLVVCGGRTGGVGERTSEVWRLDLGALRWEHVSDLTLERVNPACCAVRGGVVVLGGFVEGEDDWTDSEYSEQEAHEHETTTDASVEILAHDAEVRVEAEESTTFTALPPLSCGPIACSVAVTIEESESELGQVLLIGGWTTPLGGSSAAVHEVDLATGACTPQPPLLFHRGPLYGCAAVRFADGRVGRNVPGGLDGTAQVLEPPERGSPSEASWRCICPPRLSSVATPERAC